MGSYSSNTSTPQPNTPLYIVVDILGYSAALLLVYAMIRWLWIIFIHPYFYGSTTDSDPTGQLSVHSNHMDRSTSEQPFNVDSVFKNQLYFRGIYMVICIFCLIEYGAINGAYVNISVFDEKALLIALIPYLTFAIATNIANMRKVKYDVLHHLVNLITGIIRRRPPFPVVVCLFVPSQPCLVLLPLFALFCHHLSSLIHRNASYHKLYPYSNPTSS